MSALEESLPWPPPDERAVQIRELRRENGKLRAVVAGLVGVGSDAGSRLGDTDGARRDLAVEMLRSIGQFRSDRHMSHYVGLARRYQVPVAEIAAALGVTEDDVCGLLAGQGGGDDSNRS
ncbi:hypothetical protein LQL77_06935 [Rhodococcus cerastii]|nr:hypothetical protein [Rhodococcus cerastii]